MKELKEVSTNYAIERTNEMFSQIVAQAFADGYRMGYKDREDEMPIDFHDGKTEFVDLGLPSGTLWSTDYEREGKDLIFLPHGKAELLNIPTMEQWEELFESCRWECVTPNGAQTDSNIIEVLCVGPNGNILKFERTGMYKVTENICGSGEIFFWLMNNEEDSEKNSVNLSRILSYVSNNNYYYQSNYRITKMFSGYKLPVRLVRTK